MKDVYQEMRKIAIKILDGKGEKEAFIEAMQTIPLDISEKDLMDKVYKTLRMVVHIPKFRILKQVIFSSTESQEYYLIAESVIRYLDKEARKVLTKGGN